MDRLLEATARAERNHFWFRGFRAFVRPLLAQAAAGRRPLRILDCGCGTGHNLQALLGPYGRAIGVDVTWRGLQYARGRGGAAVIQATVARLPFPDASFDLVTSFDVLYCLPEEDERLAVAEMARVLVGGGHAVINVPALRLLRGDHSVLSHERRRYTRAGLRRLVEAAGFEVRRLTYTNASLVPLLAVLRTGQRWRGLAASDREAAAIREIAVPPAPMNALLTALLAAEAQLVRLVDLPIGSSLVCLARKPGG